MTTFKYEYNTTEGSVDVSAAIKKKIKDSLVNTFGLPDENITETYSFKLAYQLSITGQYIDEAEFSGKYMTAIRAAFVSKHSALDTGTFKIKVLRATEIRGDNK